MTIPQLMHHKGRMFDKFRPFTGNRLAMPNDSSHPRQRPGEVRQVAEDVRGLAVTIVGEALPADHGELLPTLPLAGAHLAPARPVRTKFTNAVYPVGLLMKAVPR